MLKGLWEQCKKATAKRTNNIYNKIRIRNSDPINRFQNNNCNKLMLYQYVFNASTEKAQISMH